MSGLRLITSRGAAIIACAAIWSNASDRADDLIDSVRQAHKASVESIRTLSCRTSIVYDPKIPTGDEQGEYWREGDVVRCKFTSDNGRKGDVFVKDGQRKSSDKIPPAMFGQSGPAPTTGMVTDTNRAINCDPWLFGLIMFPGKTKFLVPFDEFLAEATKVNSVKRVDDRGRSLVLLDVAHARGRFEIWFDPAVNYLVRRRVLWSPTVEHLVLSDQEVTEFQEGCPGIYFPRLVKTTADRHDSPEKQRMTVTFSKLRINQPIPPETLRFKYPQGVKVVDVLQNQVKVADAAGEPTKPALTETGEPITLAPGVLIQHAPEEAPHATEHEPQSWTRWLLPASLGVFGIGALLWVVQWWRSRVSRGGGRS